MKKGTPKYYIAFAIFMPFLICIGVLLLVADVFNITGTSIVRLFSDSMEYESIFKRIFRL